MKTFIYADKFFLNSGVKGAGYLDVTDGIFGTYTKEKPEGAEIDPCPGTCGQNADCQVINHLPSCICRGGYTGDPFVFCNVVKMVSPSKNSISIAMFIYN